MIQPRLATADIEPFQQIMDTHFQGGHIIPNDQYQLDKEKMTKVCQEKGHTSDKFVQKCLEIQDTSKIRHSIGIVGDDGAAVEMVVNNLGGSTTVLTNLDNIRDLYEN